MNSCGLVKRLTSRTGITRFDIKKNSPDFETNNYEENRARLFRDRNRVSWLRMKGLRSAANSPVSRSKWTHAAFNPKLNHKWDIAHEQVSLSKWTHLTSKGSSCGEFTGFAKKLNSFDWIRYEWVYEQTQVRPVARSRRITELQNRFCAATFDTKCTTTLELARFAFEMTQTTSIGMKSLRAA